MVEPPLFNVSRSEFKLGRSVVEKDKVKSIEGVVFTHRAITVAKFCFCEDTL